MTPDRITKTRTVLGRKFTYQRRPSTKEGSPWGRFGGGWDFHLGIQSGRRTVLLSLGHSTLRIDRKKAKA